MVATSRRYPLSNLQEGPRASARSRPARRAPSSAAAVLVLVGAFAGCGALERDSGQPASSAGVEATRSGVLVEPDRDFGTLELVPPCKALLPDWSPPSSHPAAPHYSPARFTVQARVGAGVVATGGLGSALRLPAGDYVVFMNDTKLPVRVTSGATTKVFAQRLDIAKSALKGTYRVNVLAGGEGSLASIPPLHGNSSCSCSTLFHYQDFPLGVGLLVLPGAYRLDFSYVGGATQSITVGLPNALEALAGGGACDGAAHDGGQADAGVLPAVDAGTGTPPARDAGSTSADGGAPPATPELCVDGRCPNDVCTRENCPHGCCDTDWAVPRWCREPGEMCTPWHAGQVCNPRTLTCE